MLQYHVFFNLATHSLKHPFPWRKMINNIKLNGQKCDFWGFFEYFTDLKVPFISNWVHSHNLSWKNSILQSSYMFFLYGVMLYKIHIVSKIEIWDAANAKTFLRPALNTYQIHSIYINKYRRNHEEKYCSNGQQCIAQNNSLLFQLVNTIYIYPLLI